jgi:hypothetical protein
MKLTQGEIFNVELFNKYGRVSIRKREFLKYRNLLVFSTTLTGKHKTLGEYITLIK